MPSTSAQVSNAIALFLGLLFVWTGQGHLSGILTPESFGWVDEVTPNAYRAFGWTGLNYDDLKRVWGALDLVTAILLLRSSTRKIGYNFAIIAAGIGLYSQLINRADITQTAIFFALTVLESFSK